AIGRAAARGRAPLVGEGAEDAVVVLAVDRRAAGLSEILRRGGRDGRAHPADVGRDVPDQARAARGAVGPSAAGVGAAAASGAGARAAVGLVVAERPVLAVPAAEA